MAGTVLHDRYCMSQSMKIGPVTFDNLKSKNKNIYIIQYVAMKSSCGRNDLNHVKLAIIF